jgi:hypothetical protein
MPKTLTIAQIRQRLQQARSAYDAGDYAKARALLKGIDHPKAQAMLAQIDAQAPAKTGFPCLPMALFVGMVGVIGFCWHCAHDPNQHCARSTLADTHSHLCLHTCDGGGLASPTNRNSRAVLERCLFCFAHHAQ